MLIQHSNGLGPRPLQQLAKTRFQPYPVLDPLLYPRPRAKNLLTRPETDNLLDHFTMYQEPIVHALDSASTSQGALTPPTASGTGPGPKHLLCSPDALVSTRLVHTVVDVITAPAKDNYFCETIHEFIWIWWYMTNNFEFRLIRLALVINRTAKIIILEIVRVQIFIEHEVSGIIRTSKQLPS